MLLPLALCALTACGKSQATKAAEANEAAYREKYAKAEALFKERCKTAGVVIKRTVKDVEGIELTKVKKPIPWGGTEYFDPMYPEAAMAGESGGDDYIKEFLMTEVRDRLIPDRRGMLTPDNGPNCERCMPLILGYKFVEYRDRATGRLFRASFPGGARRADWRVDFKRDHIPASSTRYALDYEDLVDPEDRELWISGTRLKVIDKQSGEMIAELTKFVWDAGFGGGATGRWPWAHAASTLSTVCPSYPNRPDHWDNRYFVDTILHPKQED
ncbi:hypothetical protein ACS5PN_15015 [Roseateles sp. NT4]|uniref:hypothetical protein n=1 Tax=Roseateles sp. NT4 TaxID=3453715 RepID=UPI003EEA6EBE